MPVREQGAIGEASAVQGFEIDEDVRQGGEMLDRVLVAHFGMSKAKLFFAVAVDALAGGALVIDPLVLRAGAIEQNAHEAAFLPIDILDAATSRGKLGLLAGRGAGLRKEQRAAKAQSGVAVGVCERELRDHAQADGAEGSAIGVALGGGMAVLVERNGSDAACASSAFINVSGIIGSVGGEVGGIEAERGDSLQVKGMEKGDVVLVERLGIFGQDDVAIDGVGTGGDAGTIAPVVFLDRFLRAVGLLFVG